MPAFVASSLMLACGLGSGPAAAAELPDPTRPPLAQRRVLPAAEQAAAPIVPVLQSVLTGAGRKPAVIISGQALELGDSFAGQRLTRVTETGAVLSGPHGTTTLALTPAADKLATATPAPAAGEAAPTVLSAARRRPDALSSITIRMADTQ